MGTVRSRAILRRMQSNAEIIEACGGSLEVAYHCNVHQTTVERWAKGQRIAPKFWRFIVAISKGAVTVRQIAALNPTP